MANVEALKAEVQRLSTALLQEASKTKALSEELETPLNVHRLADAPAHPMGWQLALSRMRDQHHTVNVTKPILESWAT